MKVPSVLLILPLALTLTVGCSDGDGPTRLQPAPLPYVEPTSPENVLANFIAAHRELDSDAYKVTTAAGFEFLPSPADTVPYDLLTKVEDDQIMESLLGDVESFEMILTYTPAVASTRQDLPASDGYMEIEAGALLRVTTRDGQAGDPLILLVNNQPCYFVFQPDSTQTPVTWKICLQQDQAAVGAAPLTMEKTWGQVKSRYR